MFPRICLLILLYQAEPLRLRPCSGARSRGPCPLARIAHAAVFGYKHHHVSITSVDATSRLPLYVISRILIDYLTKQLEEARTAAEKRKQRTTRRTTSKEALIYRPSPQGAR